MTGWTQTNIRTDVEDAAVGFGLSPDMEARFARKTLDAESIGVAFIRLAPDFRQAFGHHHDQDEELYVVVKGSGRVKLEDDIVELHEWDAVRVAPATMRCFEAGPDGLEYLAFGTHTPGDGETVSGWWPNGDSG